MEDRELELLISSSLEKRQREFNHQIDCKNNLFEIYDAVISNEYFTRFGQILQHQLGDIEKRLIILYFVDSVLVSQELETAVRYKRNIFDEIASGLNG